MKLFINFRIFDDRSCDQLRKHGHIQGKIQQVLLHLDISPVHIDDVGKDLESIKRNPYRQRHLPERNVHRQRHIQTVQHKSFIFKKAKHGQVYRYIKHQTFPRCFLIAQISGNIQSADVVKDDGKNHQKQIDRLTPGIKYQASQQKHRILHSFWQNII